MEFQAIQAETETNKTEFQPIQEVDEVDLVLDGHVKKLYGMFKNGYYQYGNGEYYDDSIFKYIEDLRYHGIDFVEHYGLEKSISHFERIEGKKMKALEINNEDKNILTQTILRKSLLSKYTEDDLKNEYTFEEVPEEIVEDIEGFLNSVVSTLFERFEEGYYSNDELDDLNDFIDCSIEHFIEDYYNKNYNGFIINYGLANAIRFYENIEGENSYSSEATTSRGQNAYFLTTYIFKTRLLTNYSEQLQEQQYSKEEESD